MPSPISEYTTPPRALDRLPQDLVVAIEAAAIASGCSSHSRVDPSRSVNKNVTVPVGSSDTQTPLGRLPQGK